jgi:uncharacterized protein (TIGR04222 family)
MNIFDLRGPEFLTFYVATLIALIVASLIVARLLRGPGFVPPRLEEELDGFDIALLSGGRRRLIDAALVSLYHRDLITPDKTMGVIDPVAAVPPATLHPIEAFLLKYIERGGVMISNLHSLHLPRQLAEERLREFGLLLPPSRVAAIFLAKTVPLVALLVVGLIKIGVGLHRTRPVGFLVMLCFATAAAAYFINLKMPWRSGRGDHVLKRFRRRHSSLQFTSRRKAVDLTWQDAAMATALFGAAAMVYGPLADIANPLRRDHAGLDAISRSNGDGGGITVGGGDAGCGAAGCGGAGCGGAGCGGGCGGCAGGN